MGSHPCQGFFFSLIKAFLHPRIKPHTLFWRHPPARIIFFFSWHCVTQSIPEDASASRWINDRSAQARAGVTRARRERERGRAGGEALGRRASRSVCLPIARAGRGSPREGGTKTRVVCYNTTTTSSRPTDPTDPRTRKESSCRWRGSPHVGPGVHQGVLEGLPRERDVEERGARRHRLCPQVDDRDRWKAFSVGIVCGTISGRRPSPLHHDRSRRRD